MIQTLLFFGLGFLTATFIGLLIAPALRRRTERLTTRRIEARLPMTRDEIQADKDRIRAEAAINQRKVEIELNAARARVAEQLVELDRHRQGLVAKDGDLSGRDGRIAALETEIETLKASVTEREEKVAQLEDRLVSEHADSFTRKSELDRLNALYEDASLTASSRQIEVAQRETDIDRLTTDLAALRNQRNEGDRKLRDLTADNKALRDALKAETRKADDAGKRIEKLVADLSDRDDRLERRESEIARLKGKASPGPDDAGDATDRISAERDRLEKKLAAPVENDAQLREQLQELAAEMVHLTATLEGPQSPILKAIESAQAVSGKDGPISLAERIQALRDVSERARSKGPDAPEPVKGDG
ncbi:hypothetical protein [Aliihoeflea sp. PC F10.4]